MCGGSHLIGGYLAIIKQAKNISSGNMSMKWVGKVLPKKLSKSKNINAKSIFNGMVAEEQFLNVS